VDRSDVAPATPAKGEPIIRVRDLDTGYEGNPILTNINFDVLSGEVFGILGGSGSGKSTLMKNMIGLLPPIKGTVHFADDDVWSADEPTRRRIVARFGVMYQSGALFGSMTLLENVRLPLETATDLPESAIDLIARMKLELVGLEAFTGHRSDHRRLARRADPPVVRIAGRHVRHRHARPRKRFHRDRSGDPPAAQGEGNHRRRRPAQAARRE
jgi:ABC-type sugar transport system ATPase subunit